MEDINQLTLHNSTTQKSNLAMIIANCFFNSKFQPKACHLLHVAEDQATVWAWDFFLWSKVLDK